MSYDEEYERQVRTNVDRYLVMVEMREQGSTYQQIADRFGISRQRAHQILHGYYKGPSTYGGHAPYPSGRPKSRTT